MNRSIGVGVALAIHWVLVTLCCFAGAAHLAGAADSGLLEVERVDDSQGWEIPAALSRCPLGNSEPVQINGITLTRTAIEICVKKALFPEDEYAFRQNELVVGHATWRVKRAFRISLDDNLVFYEVWVAPVDVGDGRLPVAELAAMFTNLYLSPTKGGRPSIRVRPPFLPGGPPPASGGLGPPMVIQYVLPDWVVAETRR